MPMDAGQNPTLDTSLLPLARGTYCLWLHLTEPLNLRAGQLGERALPPGLCAYVGSALGPGGLRARVGRHLRAEKPMRWHIDWLTAHASVRAVWLRTGRARLECGWAVTLLALPGAEVAWPGFGASDCACASHLIAVPPTALAGAWSALTPEMQLGTRLR